MTSSDIRRLRGRLDLTQEAFGLLMGTSLPTVSRWEAGKIRITSQRAAIMGLIEQAIEKAGSVMSHKIAASVRLDPLGALVEFICLARPELPRYRRSK